MTTTVPATTTTQPRSTTTTTTAVAAHSFVPVGGEASFNYFLGGSFAAANCPGLQKNDQRNISVGSQHLKEDREGATVGWLVSVCLSWVEEGPAQPIVGPVTVTRPDGATYEASHVSRPGCAWYDDDGCDILLELSAAPEHLGRWTVSVMVDGRSEPLEYSLVVAAPDVPTVIRPMWQESLLVTGEPGTRPRMAALLARADCSRTGTPPEEYCETVYVSDEPEWVTVLQTEIAGPTIGPDGTAWFDPPAIDWPSVPDPEPGLPYYGDTRVCYAVIHGGSLAAGFDIDPADCARSS